MLRKLKRKIHSKYPLVWQRLGQAKQEWKWRDQDYYCDNQLISLFETYLNFPFGYYVDVGAHDGRSGSNTLHLEAILNWNGVLIEPILHNYFRCREIRSHEKNLFFCCACVENEFPHSEIQMFYSNKMSTLNRTNLRFDPQKWAENGSSFLLSNEHVIKTWAEARTLNSILEEAESPRVLDFLSIDVEGSEYAVLNGLDLNKFRFKFILIETEINSDADVYLLKNDYKLITRINENNFYKYDYL